MDEAVKLRWSTALLLCLTLLLTQWTGVQHRVVHAAGAESNASRTAWLQDSDATAHGVGTHDCKLFDHACHADGVMAWPSVPELTPAAPAQEPKPHWVSWTHRHLFPPAHGPPVQI